MTNARENAVAASTTSPIDQTLDSMISLGVTGARRRTARYAAGDNE
jgi:hypothetical protein